MAAVVVGVRSEYLPGALLVPGTHQDTDAEDTREAALVLSAQFALDSFALKCGLEDFRLGKVIGWVDHHWLVCVRSRTPFWKKKNQRLQEGRCGGCRLKTY